MASVKPIPDGYHTVTPFILVQGADKLIDFVKKAFDAKETERYLTPSQSLDDLKDTITRHIRTIDTIRSTMTLIVE